MDSIRRHRHSAGHDNDPNPGCAGDHLLLPVQLGLDSQQLLTNRVTGGLIEMAG